MGAPVTRRALPTVTVVVGYDEALRLSYMARFPERDQPGDDAIADKVDAAIRNAEEADSDPGA